MNMDRRDLLALSLGAGVFSNALSRSPLGSRSFNACRDDAAWTFHDAADMAIEGRGWSDVTRPFSRLPDRAQEHVREVVWKLAQDSAGLYVEFTTDATSLRFEVVLKDDALAMPHMPASGVSGLDLYARDVDGEWSWVRGTQPSKKEYGATVRGLLSGEREYRLYLPLYNGVDSLRIGVPKAAKCEPTAKSIAPPIVYYGTSIAQGACASRPGMAFVSQLGRRLDHPMLNLGFSGNGRLELELCDLIAELDAQVYVLDCLPNLQPDETADRTVPFVERLRAARPETAIVMVEDRVNTNARWFPARADHHQRNHAAFRAGYEKLVESGMVGLTYVADQPFLGADGEAAVDGSHPTDLGMTRYADGLEPILRKLMNR